MIDEKRLNQEEQIRAYAEIYARNLIMFGVDVSEKLETATQMSYALNQAYLRGRQDEINRLSKDSKWIPCSERLPQRQDSENTILKMYITQSRYGIVRIGFVDENGIWRNEHGNRMFVIAWQPLPEPYKED